jgi:hypothetical protein
VVRTAQRDHVSRMKRDADEVPEEVVNPARLHRHPLSVPLKGTPRAVWRPDGSA